MSARGTTPRARFLRHHDEDDPGLVGSSLERLGYEVDVVSVDDRTANVELADVAMLAVLGSKWSVYDDDNVGGWLKTELDTIREADRRGIPVLGICFGAQALCVALGGSVTRAPTMELGWTPLDGNVEAGIPGGPWFQFHEDQCHPPPSAQVLVRNEVCVQAFGIGRHLGVQFHPELDAAQLSRWLSAGADEAAVAYGVDPATLLETTRELEVSVAPRVDLLVAAFLAA